MSRNEDYRRLLEKSIDSLAATCLRIEDKLDKKTFITDKRLDRIENKLAWYAGGIAVLSAFITLVVSNTESAIEYVKNIKI